MSMLKFSRIYEIGVFVLLGLFLTAHPATSIGLTSPLPAFLKLLRGDSTEFFFQLQNLGNSNKIKCTYSIDGLSPLSISFEGNTVIVDANSIKNVYGTVTVPADAPIKSYHGSLTATCEPLIEGEVTGSKILNTMIVSFDLSVVAKPEERAAPSLPKEEIPPLVMSTSGILLIVILVVVIIGIGYWASKKSKK